MININSFMFAIALSVGVGLLVHTGSYGVAAGIVMFWITGIYYKVGKL